jgi:hypothetical protein
VVNAGSALVERKSLSGRASGTSSESPTHRKLSYSRSNLSEWWKSWRRDAAVRACVDASVWALPEPQLLSAVDAVHVLEQRLAAVKLALVREVDGRGIAVAQGASSTTVWLRDRLRLSVGTARRMVATAAAVDAGPPPVREALAAGSVSAEQVGVIAETEEAERAALQRAERRAHRDRHLTLSAWPDGQTRITGSLDAEAGALLRAVLDPLTAPTGVDDDRSPGQRRHDALAEVCRLAVRAGELPDVGGDATQLVVTVGFDPLAGQLSAGSLDTGVLLTPQVVRRLACDCGHPARSTRRAGPSARHGPTAAVDQRGDSPGAGAARSRLRLSRM